MYLYIMTVYSSWHRKRLNRLRIRKLHRGPLLYHWSSIWILWRHVCDRTQHQSIREQRGGIHSIQLDYKSESETGRVIPLASLSFSLFYLFDTRKSSRFFLLFNYFLDLCYLCNMNNQNEGSPQMPHLKSRVSFIAKLVPVDTLNKRIAKFKASKMFVR